MSSPLSKTSQNMSEFQSRNSNMVKRCEIDLNQMDSDWIFHQDIVQSIYQEYFDLDETFNPTRFELYKLPSYFNSEDITLYCEKLIQQHYIVSKKVLLLVLQKQFECQEEFKNILEIQQSLANIIQIFKICRSDLNLVTHRFTSSSLKILYYCKKRKILEGLLNILYSIRTLYRIRDRLKKLIQVENYSKAILLVLEYQRTAETYKQYNCVLALFSNLNDILEQIEENLDRSLSKICINFESNNYASIQAAFYFLGKFEVALDQLQMHYTAAIHNTAYNSIVQHTEDDSKKLYSDLCKSIELKRFLPCLVELCKSLLIIIKSYVLIMEWHKQYNIKYLERKENKESNTGFNQLEILQKIESGVIRIFNDIEKKLIVYIDSFNLTPLKFEEFMQVLNIVDRVIRIGKKLSKKEIMKLEKFMQTKLVNYFEFYHAYQLDELKVFLENDGWKLCPIMRTFKVTDLLEFKALKTIFILPENQKNFNEMKYKSKCHDTNDLILNCIEDLISFLDTIPDNFTEEHILKISQDNQLQDLSEDTDEDEVLDELKYDYVDEMQKENFLKKKKKEFGPIVTNTTLSVLRICGKYLQVTEFFEDFAITIVQYMIQIFELYFYAVHDFFTVDFVISDFPETYSTNLKRAISRIKDYLIASDSNETENIQLHHKIDHLRLSSVIDLNDSSKLFSLSERIVAVESLIFLGQQYHAFRLYLNSILLSDQDQVYLNHFYSQTIPLTVALRKPIYMASIYKFFNMSKVFISMNKVDWELRDVISLHSNYIDLLIEDVILFKTKLMYIQNYVPLHKEIYESIWENVAHLIANTLVEGFSNVKKCSHGGRALMQLDFTQLISKFESITLLKPMPHQEYVTSYIKAYYLPESNLETWIKTHSEYSSKHLIGLITCAYQSRKFKQKLMSFIEDQRMHR